MTVKKLLEQLNYALQNNYINENDELICVGTGKKKTGLFTIGFCLPKVIVSNEVLFDTNDGYGIGVLECNSKVVK